MRQYLLTLTEHQRDLLFKMLEHAATNDPHGLAHELLVTLPPTTVIFTRQENPDKVISIFYKRDPDGQSRRIDQEKLSGYEQNSTSS